MIFFVRRNCINCVRNYTNCVYSHTTLKHRLSSTAILGIETSCDDTGCAIIDEHGKVLGESLRSQGVTHLRYGGIIPDIAQDFHRNNIEPTVAEALHQANMKMEDVTAIAVTLEPGLPLSLAIGMKYAKHLSRRYSKPLIPIHHMEAHALAPRMQYTDITFPYLVLLISGGHCLLAIAKDVNKFLLLGESIDSAPGEVFDKVARKMKLRNIPEYSKLCGGQAVELAAEKATNMEMFKLPLPLAEYKDCNFSFNGLKTSVLLHHFRKEREHNIIADGVIPEVNNLCAAMVNATSKHLVHRIQRGVEFCENNNLLQSNKQLVVSGGVACNNIIFKTLKKLCSEINFEIYRPKPELCTDNGIMIAWNGLEKWRRKIDIVSSQDLAKLDIRSVSPLGTSLITKVKAANLRIKLMKFKTYERLLFNRLPWQIFVLQVMILMCPANNPFWAPKVVFVQCFEKKNTAVTIMKNKCRQCTKLKKIDNFVNYKR